jgi:hypothetical protein
VKPRNREVSIFNMSVLDLLTGALGAFCFLTLALFPSYFKVTNASAAASQVSAADAAQAATAADELKGLNIKLKSELANVSQNQNGMPPFAMGYVSIMDASGQSCGGYQITDYSGPGGQEAIKILPTSVTNGYDVGVDLFSLAPGDYHITFNAYANTSGCNLTITQMGASGTNQTQIPVTGRNLASYTAKFSVAAADLSFADVLKP